MYAKHLYCLWTGFDHHHHHKLACHTVNPVKGYLASGTKENHTQLLSTAFKHTHRYVSQIYRGMNKHLCMLSKAIELKSSFHSTQKQRWSQWNKIKGGDNAGHSEYMHPTYCNINGYKQQGLCRTNAVALKGWEHFSRNDKGHSPLYRHKINL